MLSQDKLEVLEQQFQRIFTLPVTRTTYRELQNVISTAFDGNNEKAISFIDSLLQNRKDSESDQIADFVKEYCIPVRVAKQVHDNGEVLSMLTTDVGMQQGNMIFSVRIRRIDGGEFSFLTDTGGFLQIAEHILSRVESMSTNPTGRAVIGSLKPRLEEMQDAISRLL